MKRLFIFFTLFIAGSLGLKAQLVADFTSNATTGCDFTNAIINFQDLSTGNPTQWNWDFGDASPLSPLQNPTHFYSNPGIYTVTLTISAGANSDSETKTNYITIFEVPTAGFTADTTFGCFPFTVNFTDQSIPGGGAFSSWIWDFGDGQISTQQNPTYTYPSPGNFNVSLFVTDVNGCEHQEIKITFVVVKTPPVASFSASDTLGCSAPFSTNLINNSTGATSYFWDFGDSNTSTVQNPGAYVYTAFGSYDLTLVTTNADGCTDTAVQNIFIGQFAADFTFNDSVVCIGEVVSFTDQTTVGANDWLWDFGDSATSTSQNPTHAYTDTGTYSVVLAASNPSACTDTIVKIITVLPPPTLNFVADSTIGCVTPFTVNFMDSTAAGMAWSWNFGDGQTSSSQNPSNIYADTGTYHVTLTVTDSNGCTGTFVDSSMIVIRNPIANFIGIAPTEGCIPLPVNFNDLSTSDAVITNWFWDFGDGNTDTVQNPTNVYTDTGAYDVTLIITNADGCTDTITYQDMVLAGIPPVADFIPLDTTGCLSFFIPFTDLSSSYANSWFWDFGDGGTDTTQNPIHTYVDTGTFDVTLIAFFNGCPDTITYDTIVKALVPKSVFASSNFIFCDTPYTVTFTDMSPGADAWQWDFGDTNTSTVPNPTHTYDTTGTYLVQLTVTNFTTGCSHSSSVSIYIPSIDIGFEQDTIVGCTPTSIAFEDTTVSSSTILFWKWSFGDGTTIGFGNGNVTGFSNTSGSYDKPIHQYSSVGFHDVILTVIDNFGCQKTDTIFNLIEIKPLPSADFSLDTNNGCLPLIVMFSDQSTSSATLVNWVWDYGDGNSDTLTVDTAIHLFDVPGLYDVTLTVIDTFNCMNSITKSNYINATYPWPDFAFDTIVCNNDLVVFTNNSTGANLNYLWDFGDGDTSTATNPGHIFNSQLDTTTSFTISLTAVDTNGCDSTLQQNITVSIPVADFFPDTTSKDCPPFIAQFNDSSTTDVITWSWNFGDSTVSSSLPEPAHTYSFAGIYDVILIVTNDDGCMDTISKDSLIFVGGPSGNFIFTIDTTGCFDTVTFVGQTQNTDSIKWVFDDGAVGIGDSIVHPYMNPGFYFPVMVITDSSGCSVNIPTSSAVQIIGPSFGVTASSIDENCTNSDGIATAFPTGGPAPFAYTWNTGDNTQTIAGLSAGVYFVTTTDSIGCIDSTFITVNATFPTFTTTFSTTDAICLNPNGTATVSVSGNASPPYSFTWSDAQNGQTATGLTQGVYEVTITDVFNCFTIDSITVNIIFPTLTATFSTTNAICANFDGTAAITGISGGTTPYTYAWPNSQFGNTVAGLQAGSYEVTITDANGCNGTGTAVIIADTFPTFPAFFTDTNDVWAEIPITFIDDSSYSSFPVTTWQWDFGDATVITNINNTSITHIYTNAGTYTATLTITDTEGCTDSITSVIRIAAGIYTPIPNVFTPNEDGINDVYRIPSSGVEYFDLKIFNRWGQLLFETNQPQREWNGRNFAGEPCPDGTYFMFLEYAFSEDVIQKVQQTIMLLR